MTETGLLARRAGAEDRLRAYMDPSGPYAYRTYDHWYGEDGALVPSDVLLANLMSLRLGWREVIPLFAEGHGEGPALRLALDKALTDLATARNFEDYESLDGLEGALASLAAANVASKSVRKWTAVTVSKVLHRRRPHIVPIIDSRVRKFYGAKQPSALRAAIWEDIRLNRDWLADLAFTRTTPDGRPLTVLRVADILIWME